MIVPAVRGRRRFSPGCCSSGTQCSRSAGFRFRAAWNPRFKRASSWILRRLRPTYAPRWNRRHVATESPSLPHTMPRPRLTSMRSSQIDSVVFARKLSEETRTMTIRMGKKFTEIGLQVIDLPFLRRWCECIEAGTTPGCYPISLAINFAVQNLSAREAFVVHQYGVAAMILGASLRLMRISHMDTQRILYDLNARVDADFQIAAQGSPVGHGGLCATYRNPGSRSHQGACAAVHELT